VCFEGVGELSKFLLGRVGTADGRWESGGGNRASRREAIGSGKGEIKGETFEWHIDRMAQGEVI